MHVEPLKIDSTLRGDYLNDLDFQQQFKDSVNALWRDKQTTFDRLQVELNYKQVQAKHDNR